MIENNLQNPVRIFDWTLSAEDEALFFEGCKEIFKTGYLTNHVHVQRLEQQLASILNVRKVFAVNSGTSALEVAMLASNLAGKKIILPTNTFIATFSACVAVHAIPIIIDVEVPQFCLGVKALEDIYQQHPDMAAVVVVHIGGHVASEMNKISQFCDEKNIVLIEDCAHAIGAKQNGISAGRFGRFGCFSTHLTKNLTTGEGGFVVCNNSDDDQIVESIRQFGKDLDNSLLHIRSGSNYKMTEFQALLGIIELRRLNFRIEKRRSLAMVYQRELVKLGWEVFKDDEKNFGSYYKQVVIPTEERYKIEKLLLEHHISLTGGVYYFPLHKQPVVKNNYALQKEYPVASKFSEMHICPPCYPELEIEDVEKICSLLIKKFGAG